MYHVMKHYDYESPFPNGFSSGQRQKGCTYSDCLVFKFQPSCNEISSVEANKGGKFTDNLCMDISFLQLPSHIYWMDTILYTNELCMYGLSCELVTWAQAKFSILKFCIPLLL